MTVRGVVLAVVVDGLLAVDAVGFAVVEVDFLRSAAEPMLGRVLCSGAPDVGVTELRDAGFDAVVVATGLLVAGFGPASALGFGAVVAVFLAAAETIDVGRVVVDEDNAVDVRRVAAVASLSFAAAVALVVAVGFAVEVVVAGLALVVVDVAVALVVVGAALDGGLFTAPTPKVPELRTFLKCQLLYFTALEHLGTFLTMGVAGPLWETLVLSRPVVEVFLVRASSLTAARGRAGAGAAGSGSAAGGGAASSTGFSVGSASVATSAVPFADSAEVSAASPSWPFSPASAPFSWTSCARYSSSSVVGKGAVAGSGSSMLSAWSSEHTQKRGAIKPAVRSEHAPLLSFFLLTRGHVLSYNRHFFLYISYIQRTGTTRCCRV